MEKQQLVPKYPSIFRKGRKSFPRYKYRISMSIIENNTYGINHLGLHSFDEQCSKLEEDEVISWYLEQPNRRIHWSGWSHNAHPRAVDHLNLNLAWVDWNTIWANSHPTVVDFLFACGHMDRIRRWLQGENVSVTNYRSYSFGRSPIGTLPTEPLSSIRIQTMLSKNTNERMLSYVLEHRLYISYWIQTVPSATVVKHLINHPEERLIEYFAGNSHPDAYDTIISSLNRATFDMYQFVIKKSLAMNTNPRIITWLVEHLEWLDKKQFWWNEEAWRCKQLHQYEYELEDTSDYM